jgi:plasmid stability protein
MRNWQRWGRRREAERRRPTIHAFAAATREQPKIESNAVTAYNAVTPAGENPMSTLTIRNLDPAVKERLRIRAAEHGHSMEAEARLILQTALKTPPRPPARNLYERIRARVEPLGGIDLDLPPREPAREPPRFD